ncbi:DEAD/DEAH box helicase family protein [Novosphingobium sp.]|uniref:DEAD/DEAH box helicase n=1 Tax=Novosphingobium sp. TaxID=1874826 RepID=UPI00286DA938|nr:DEAD/DEAH box helicase family protein [Novosphingobium sp.]
MAIQLRPYQEQCLADLWQWFCDKTGNPLAVLPTGAGKSLVIAEWCKFVFETDPGAGILVLTHVRELVAQNAAELAGLWPEAPWGIYSAGLNRRDITAPLMFASIQSIHKKAFKIPRRIDMVLVDEAHLIPRTSDTMYGKFLADLKVINPSLKIIGLTATPFRLDSGRLDEGQGAMFDGIAHDSNVRDLIDDGYLCPPVSFRQSAQIDTTGIGSRGGEFIAAQIEANAMEPDVIDAIANRICEAGRDRKGWLIFGCTVKHCEALAEALNARGHAGRGVFGDTDQSEGKGTRDRTIADFKAGRLRFLVSQGVLTTGFNARHVDMIALARPTKSTGLYIQMVGRGTRLSPETDKADCLILDFGGNIARHGPFDDPFIPEKRGKGEGAAPFKECPECECACGTMTRQCPSCGYEFPPPERVVDIRPAEKPILSVEPEWLDVADVSYRAHSKAGSPDSMVALYRIGMTYQREWVCFNHTGYARTKAESWWLRRAPAPVPRTVEEAIARAGEVTAPSHIRVRRNGKYDEIIAFKFEPERQVA